MQFLSPSLLPQNPFWVAPLAFMLVLAFTPIMIRLAHVQGWVALPRADRWHQKPTALMGGIAIYAGVSLSWLLLAQQSSLGWALWGGGTIMFLTGVIDDRRNLSPMAKLVAQIVAVGVLFYSGYKLDFGGGALLAFPLTFLWVAGVTNAVNLLDNMDGLAAGVSGIAAVSIAGLFAASGDLTTAALALAVGGAAAGFLVFNFKPARIFMGDSGSLFLGFAVSVLALALPIGRGAPGLLVMLLVLASVVAVAIFDTTLVTVKRVVSGRPVSQGGRDHSSHRLVSLGLSERAAVLTLYGVSVLFGCLALMFRYLDFYLYSALLVFSVIGLGIFGVFLAGVKVYDLDVESRTELRVQGRGNDPFVVKAVFKHRKQIARIFTDLLLVTSALVVAYHLRFDGDLTRFQQARMMSTLPLIAALKMGTFYFAGLYRGIWRYAGAREIARVVKVSAVASASTVLLLVFLYRFDGFSRSVFVIDWLVTTVALVGARTAFRGFRGYLSGMRSTGTRVLLYGAGDAGYIALREISQNHGLGFVPVGFIDDDPTKQGHRMAGLPVIGTGQELAELCKRHTADEVILTMAHISAENRATIRGRCMAAGIRCRELTISFAPVEPDSDAATRHHRVMQTA